MRKNITICASTRLVDLSTVQDLAKLLDFSRILYGNNGAHFGHFGHWTKLFHDGGVSKPQDPYPAAKTA
jgi:hypothetical protein